MPVTINGTTGVIGPDGSAGTPAYQGSDANTGMFFPAADTIAFAEGGVEVARFNADAQFVVTAGTASLPVITTTGDTNTGIFFPAADTIAFTEGGTESARIDSSGNLLVGDTYQDGKVSISSNLTALNGLMVKNTVTQTGTQWFINFRNSTNGNAGNIAHTGTTTVAYNTSSDYRLKEEVQPMTGALAKVAALKPVTYKWKSDGSDGQGFIAHELQAVVPDCVTGEKDAVDDEGNPEYQGIDTSFLVATLTAAIQEQQALITSLTARIAALEGAAQ
jgi:hypothetical protein